MAYTKVGVGAVANDNTGDPIRTAFQTLNANLVIMDTTYSSSNTLIIGDDPANLGTPAGFENTISTANASNDDITIAPDGTGSIVLDGLNWPQADGTANFVLFTNGAGQLGWVSQDLSVDTTPQLGGNLDVNTNSIVSTAAGNITLTPDTTGNIVLGTITIDADQTAGAGQTGFALVADGAGVMTLTLLATAAQGTLADSAVQIVTSTTAALIAVANAINTSADKVAGYMVWNTTSNAPVWAIGNADADDWHDATGAIAHNPA